MKNFSIVISLIMLLNCFCFGFSSNINNKNSAYALESLSSSSATNENDYNRYLTGNYATYYFSNLSNNYGYNLLNSCGYVAVAMLLSYYDTYWNDDIIPESYDKSSIINMNQITVANVSPGILPDKQLFQNSVNLSLSDNYSLVQIFSTGETDKSINYYNNYVLPNADKYFHLKLLHIGNTQGIYNVNKSDPFLTNLNQIQRLLEYYLYTYLGLTETQISFTSVTDGLFSKPTRNFTIEKVKQGIPVLFRAKNSSGDGGHSFIVYDYDEANDELYGHLGWYPYNIEHVKLSTTNYNGTLWDATVLNVNLPHKHSNNYVYTDSNGVTTTHCPCELAIHPAHVHNYTYNYSRLNDTSHDACCVCGDKKTVAHSYNLNCEFIDSDTHYGTCACGVYGVSEHSYTDRYVRKDGKTHYSYCACGDVRTSGHVLKQGSTFKPFATCILCKGAAEMGFIAMESENAEYVTENGSYILPDGITVLADEDVDAYLNGTLRFHKKGEVAA